MVSRRTSGAPASASRRRTREDGRRMDANPVSRYFNGQRGFILKEGSLPIRNSISVSVAVSVVVTASVEARVIRGQPWYRRNPKVWWEDVREMVMRPIRRYRGRRKLAALEAARRRPPVGEVVESSQFDHPGLQDRPAVDVVREYLDGLEAVVNEAEARFRNRVNDDQPPGRYPCNAASPSLAPWRSSITRAQDIRSPA